MIKGLIESIDIVNNKYKSCNARAELAKMKLKTGKVDYLLFETSIDTQKDLILQLQVYPTIFRYLIICPELYIDDKQIVCKNRTFGLSVVTYNYDEQLFTSKIAENCSETVDYVHYIPFKILGSLSIYLLGNLIVGVVNQECVFVFRFSISGLFDLRNLSIRLLASENLLEFYFTIFTKSYERRSIFISLRDYSVVGELSYSL